MHTPPVKQARQMLLTLLGCTVLSACGGGGDTPASAGAPAAAPAPIASVPSAAEAAVSLPPASAADVLAATVTPVATGGDQKTSANAVRRTPPKTTTLAPPDTGVVLTSVGVENTGTAQVQVPVTFGQVFAPGDLPANYTVTGRLADGTAVPLQVDVKATHADGSVRHALLSAVLPSLAQGQTQQISLVKTAASAAYSVAANPAALLGSGFDAAINVTIGGQVYSFSPAAALRSGAYTTWLSGSLVQEWVIAAPLTTAASVNHPHLTARMAVRWYPGLNQQARIEVVVENNKTFAAGAQNFTYDVNVNVAGRTAYTQSALTHYHHARWRKLFWWSQAGAPAVHVRHNSAYLMSTKAVSNYDQTVKVTEATLNSLAAQITSLNTGPMKAGPVVNYMPTTGGRGDIGPLPAWSAAYLLSTDKRAYSSMMAAADGAASWSVHYRDENTGYPLRLDNSVNRNITNHGNLATRGPLPVPRCANNDNTLCATPLTADAAHQPSLVYLPYLLTGDHFYLEELQFWAAFNPLGTDPGNRGYELGLVRYMQLRAQAWSLRTLGHVAYITPDQHYMKSYWNTQLNNNLDYFHTSFVSKNPNQLGVYDGSGVGMADPGMQPAAWQDDFFTWSMGYLTELGFAKAKPIFDWKAKYPVGRMTAPGYCWIEATPYILPFRPAAGQPVFTSFADLYKNLFKGGVTDDGLNVLHHPTGIDYLSLPCGGQAQADWRTVTGKFVWAKGRMLGYADSTVGYPANMQPALALAASSGLPNAAQAWTFYASRGAKPDYTKSPQWAIVPR